MWSPRSTDCAALRRFGLAGLALLAIAGCTSTGPAKEVPAVRAAGGTSGVALPAAAQALFDQAAAVMAEGDLVDAELRFQEFVLQYPGVPAAYVNLAIIRQHSDNLDGAREAVDQALTESPDYAPALNQLGVLLRKSGDFTGAEAAYMKAVTVSPDYALAHFNLGVLNELYLQRLDVALQHFERYQELSGGDEEVEKWITDLTRRVAANQRSVSVAE